MLFKLGRKHADTDLRIFQRRYCREAPAASYEGSVSQSHIYLEQMVCFPEYIGFINFLFKNKIYLTTIVIKYVLLWLLNRLDMNLSSHY